MTSIFNPFKISAPSKCFTNQQIKTLNKLAQIGHNNDDISQIIKKAEYIYNFDNVDELLNDTTVRAMVNSGMGHFVGAVHFMKQCRDNHDVLNNNGLESKYPHIISNIL